MLARKRRLVVFDWEAEIKSDATRLLRILDPIQALRMSVSKTRSTKGITGDLAGFIVSASIIFAAVYSASLTFVYVEGDDATSVVYHAMGRVSSLQPPYSSYHGMMDVFLGWLPASEPIIRHVAISMTAAAGLLMVVLVLLLIREWLESVSGRTAAIITLLLLACSPEIFYLALVYTPSLAAMCFVLGAHLALRKLIDSPDMSGVSFPVMFALSAVLFGIGVACRWDVGTYLFFIIADILLNFGSKGARMRVLAITSGWAASAFVMSLLSIWLSGYGLEQIQSTLALARKEVLHWDSWFALFGAYQTFFTPAFVIAFVVGWFVLLRHNWRLALLSVLGLIPVIPFLFSREPKMILPALPGLWLAVSTGVRFVFEETVLEKRFYWLKRVGFAVMAALPWLVSLQVESAETSWGPGFNIKIPVTRETTIPSEELISDQVNKRSVAVRRWNLNVTGGFAIPTPEGPRPLGGHLSTLFGGEWRSLNLAFDRERRSAIETAIGQNYNLLQDEGNSLVVAKLLELGYRTDDPKVNYESALVTQRRFVNDDGRIINLLLLRARSSLFEPGHLRSLGTLNPNGKVVLFSGYSSTIRKLVEDAPASADVRGPFSAVVDLEALANSLDN